MRKLTNKPQFDEKLVTVTIGVPGHTFDVRLYPGETITLRRRDDLACVEAIKRYSISEYVGNFPIKPLADQLGLFDNNLK